MISVVMMMNIMALAFDTCEQQHLLGDSVKMGGGLVIIIISGLFPV